MRRRHNVSTIYLPETLVKMRAGGASWPGIRSAKRMLWENYQSWKVNELPLPIHTLFMKRFSKLHQFFRKT